MSCPGLHCPGCTEGQSIAITGGAVLGLVLAAETVQWVAERIWWISGTLAACLALSVAASMALEARADRRGARFAAAHGILSRADVVLPGPARTVTATVIPQAGHAAQPPAIAPALTLNFYGADSGDMAARVIRTALPGSAGEAITEE